MDSNTCRTLFLRRLPFRFLPESINNLLPPRRYARQLFLHRVPPEVVVEVMKRLDWRSVLRLRVTARLFHELSRARAVWISQYYHWVEDTPAGARLEKPLSMHPTAEIERLVLFRRSVDAGWERSGNAHLRRRSVQIERVWSYYLIPGGRWFLAGTFSGEVMLYDLNSLSTPPVRLVSSDETEHPVELFSVDIDSELASPLLAFHIMFSAKGHHPLASRAPWKVEVWRVSFGIELEPSAYRLSTFVAPCDAPMAICIAIQGTRCARSLVTQRPSRQSAMEIFDWKQSTNTLHRKAVLYTERSAGQYMMQFLRDNRLLCFSEDQFSVYDVDIEDHPPTAISFPPQHLTSPIWTLELPSGSIMPGSLSPVVHNQNTTQFLFTTEDSMFHIDIPVNGQFPSLAKIPFIHNATITYCSTGYQKVYLVHLDGTAARFSLHWNKHGFTPPKAAEKQKLLLEEYFTILLDETTGRLVQYTDKQLSVVDTALITLHELC